METLLSVEEAARRLGGISKWTIHAWLSQGRLQRTKVGARTMIRESELAKVIDDGGKSPAPHRGVRESLIEARGAGAHESAVSKRKRSRSRL
jgi:excisionase family DNA binding protein